MDSQRLQNSFKFIIHEFILQNFGRVSSFDGKLHNIYSKTGENGTSICWQSLFLTTEHNKLYIIQPTSDCVVDHILLIDIYSWMLKAIQSYLDLGVAMDTVINYTPLNFCIIVWSCDSSTFQIKSIVSYFDIISVGLKI